jgi:NADH:ubiquinone oxidoreductase subunit 5 (subunit L)/multisubunit Na+/H+ antiporter MnhA subunit
MSAASQPFFIAAATAPAWPAVACLLIGILSQRRQAARESTVVGISQLALWISFFSQIAATIAYFVQHAQPVDLPLGYFYRAGDYGFELRFLLDDTSLPISLVASLLLLATSRFSAHYLHRERGFNRFFALMLVFSCGIQLTVLAGSYDLLFAGWDLVGLTSVLLVGFFQKRAGPVRAAMRVLVTYRLCDVGLLIAPILLHLSIHSSAFVDMQGALTVSSEHHAVPATAAALFLLIAAMGKSAQFPVGGWLPRAMEGPTASSAVFYGGLSVHAGVYLLIRSAPLFDQAPFARLLLIVIGGVTAVMAVLSGQVSGDAKSGLAYATIGQVGLMFVECGLGMYRLATVHLIAHAVLRYYQFLRIPSTLQDALEQRAALGTQPAPAGRSRFDRLTLPIRILLYRLAIERFEVETALDRFIARPVYFAARWLGELEARIAARLGGDERGGQP